MKIENHLNEITYNSWRNYCVLPLDRGLIASAIQRRSEELTAGKGNRELIILCGLAYLTLL